MASQYELSAKRTWAELRSRVADPLIYYSLTYDVCERTPDGEDWVKAYTVVDVHVLIDTISGERLVVHHDEIKSLDRDFVRRFFALCKRAKPAPSRSTVTKESLDFIRDETHRANFAFGGQRGMKTQSVAQACERQWAIKGGKGVNAFWVAPELKQTQIAVDKLCRGEDDLAPLFPEGVVVSYPEKHTVADQWIRMIDGTRIHLMHASDSKKGGNLKGYGPRWICLDELCEFRSVAVWRIIRGRVNKRAGHLGQIFGASTPMEGHWAYPQIVLPIDSGSKPKWRYVHLSMFDNVFIPLSEAHEALEDAGGEDDPYAQREVLGKWSFAGSQLWYRFDAKTHVEAFDRVEDLGLRDVTEKAVLKLFGGVPADVRSDMVAGQDFNNVPCSTVLAKVCVPQGEKSRPENWVLVLCDEFLTRNQQDMHGDLLAAAHERLPIVCDPSGAQVGHNPRLDQSATEAAELESAGHRVRPAHWSDDLEPYQPPQIDSLRVLHRLMRQGRFFVHIRCSKTINALATQLATPRGTIDKEPGKASDKLSGPTDAMRYLAWPLFSEELYSVKRQTGS